MSTTAAAKLNKHILLRNTALNRLKETLELGTNISDDKQKIIFLERVKNVDSIYHSFQDAHNVIIGLIKDDDFSMHDKYRAEFDQVFYQIKAIHSSMNLSPVSSPTNPTPSASSRLPKIQIKRFGGDLREWPAFIDLFNSLVHNNNAVSKIEKFHHLITNLSDEAHNLIKGLPLVEANYGTAYDLLNKRYDNKRLLATAYYNQLQSAVTMQRPNSKDLRTMIDTFNENISALKALGFPTNSWDFVLFNMLLQKIDSKTRTEFEVEHGDVIMPTFKQLTEFLENYSKALDSAQLLTTPSKPKSLTLSSPAYHVKRANQASSFLNNVNPPAQISSNNFNTKCVLCNAFHPLYKCPQFFGKSIDDRVQFATTKKLCKNCLSSIHKTSECASSSRCRSCNRPHHSLLHFNNSQSQTSDNLSGPSTQSASQNNTVVANQSLNTMTTFNQQSTVLLSTAVVHVLDKFGNYQTARILIDNGSMVNFISEPCLNKLGLSRKQSSLRIQGLNDMSTNCNNGATVCNIKPTQRNTPTFNFEAIVVPQICNNQPLVKLNFADWQHLKGLELADPNFNLPSSIDILIGAELAPYIFKQSKIFGKDSHPVAIDSTFGWILQGRANVLCDRDKITSLYNFHISAHSSVDQTLRKFWEIEQVNSSFPTLTPEESQCEELFRETTDREQNGRFVVSLPFKNGEPHLGDSYNQALRRFILLENRLSKNPTLFSAYSEFMQDYLNNGHMSSIGDVDFKREKSYYIPHHSVYRPDSSSTKLRVVFDASAKTTLGISLNDTLLIGPKLQKDIFTILLNFRQFAIAFICDIKQMFRQINIVSNHRDYQRILWRFSKDEQIQEFRLNTVTYGLTCSPYLANRTISELSKLYEATYPNASYVLQNYIYVDDIVYGANDISSALNLQNELINIMKLGKFELRKWASNCFELLNDPTTVQSTINFDQEEPQFIKVLGLRWNPSTDTFFFTYTSIDGKITKRHILSEISRIYDPLGFLSPCVMYAKLIMQQLWVCKIPWDNEPNECIKKRWLIFKAELPLVSEIKISRQFLFKGANRIELHAFADASQLGYCAVAYFRVSFQSGDIKIFLIGSKSRVAPLKSLSIPRLELCACMLLTDLVVKINQILNSITIDKLYAWSDSQTVLSWINSMPYTKKTFVANRISHIQESLADAHWHYVPTADNPADAGSRGVLPSQLVTHSLWWSGPHWLSQTRDHWPHQPKLIDSKNDEESKPLALMMNAENHIIGDLFHKYSSLLKIQRILAYIYRFKSYKRSKTHLGINNISDTELEHALIVVVKFAQTDCFENIFYSIKNEKPLPKIFKKLSVFIDDVGCLRVGGRLRNSLISYEAKHPLLLPSRHIITQRIIELTHKQNLHPGYKTLHYLLLQKFWILSPRSAISKCLSKCLKCFRVKPKSNAPIMADLPPYRVSQQKAFSVVTLDYAGPFNITLSRIRGAKILKAYVCIFVCCAVKAIHLELASNLSTEAFIAAFRRFIARRGRCSQIFSDQGTNFIGAYNQFIQISNSVSETLNLRWSFNPPASPHFNGLSEAGVKSVKTHLDRVIGTQILSYEELNTLLIQIEALLNSRPLCPCSHDPNDLQALTPGHFLTLEPLNSTAPDPDLSHLAIGKLNRWQLIQKMNHDFWKRWHSEYLHTLQQRSKWYNDCVNIKLDTLVLVKNEQNSPLNWELARVVELHPGSDGTVRVATVKSTRGTFKRPIVKLCPLPLN